MNTKSGSEHGNIVLNILGGSALVCALLLSIPFLVDLKFLKSPIQKAVRQNIHGEVDFSSANLDLFPRPGITVKNFVLRNADSGFNSQAVVVADQATISAAFRPLFRKKVLGRIFIDKPSINILSLDGRNNIAALVPELSTKEPPRGKAPETESGIMLFIREHVEIATIRMEDASVIFRTSLSGEPLLTASAIDAEVNNVGFKRDITGIISTNLKFAATDTVINGPVFSEFSVRIDPPQDATKMTATFKATVSLNELAILYADLFLKEPGMSLSLALAGNVTAAKAQITSLTARIHDLAMNGTAFIRDFSNPVLTAKMEGSTANILAFADLFPRHQSLFQSGSFNMEATYDGPVTSFEKLKATANGNIILSASDIAFAASASSFQPLQAEVRADSKRLDVAALLDPILKENPLNQLTLKNVSIQLSQRGKKTNLNRINADVFEGIANGSGSLDFALTPVAWQGRLDTKNIAVQPVLIAFLDRFKGLVSGKLSLDSTFSGSGFESVTLQQSLKVLGNFRLDDGVLYTGSIAPEIEAALTAKVKGLSILSAASDIMTNAEKILENPVFRELPDIKQLNLGASKQSYEHWNDFDFAGTLPELKNIEKSISGTFAVENGRIALKTTLPVPAGTYAFNGSVGLDKTLNGKLILTTSTLVNERVKTRSQYASLLFNDQGMLVIPLAISGGITSPSVRVDFRDLQKTFTANARALLEHEVKQQLEAALQKAIGQQRSAIEKKVNELPVDKKNQATGILKDIIKKRL